MQRGACSSGLRLLFASSIFQISSSGSAVDHEVQQSVHVLFLRCDDLHLGDLAVGKDICQGYILGQFGFQIQSVTLASHQLHAALAAIYYAEKFVYVFDILNFHRYNPPVIGSFSFTSRLYPISL